MDPGPGANLGIVGCYRGESKEGSGGKHLVNQVLKMCFESIGELKKYDKI